MSIIRAAVKLIIKEHASRVFSGARELIIRDGVVWIPVEVTERRGGFMKAWAEGAREWREAVADSTAVPPAAR